MTIAPLTRNLGSVSILPNLYSQQVSVARIQRFYQLKYWSLNDCLALLVWHLTHERHYRQGWNNNLSLTNYDLPSNPDELTWSLMLYKLDYFDVSYALIVPFKFETDSRDQLRTYTTFALIRDNAIVYCRKTNRVLTDTDRAPVVDGLIKRIYLGFGWKQTVKTKKYPIRRYRLLTILNSPDLFLTRAEDVHHLDGVEKILKGGTSTLNDTIRNLKPLPRDAHYQVHQQSLDFEWKDM